MAESNEQQWFVCLGCGCRLAPVGARKGRTVIPVQIFGLLVWVDRAEFTCPNCRKERRFFSAPVARKEEPGERRYQGLT